MSRSPRQSIRIYPERTEYNPAGWAGHDGVVDSERSIETFNEVIQSVDSYLPPRVKPCFHRKQFYSPGSFRYYRWDRFAGKPTWTSLHTTRRDFPLWGELSAVQAELMPPGFSVDWDSLKEKALPSLRNQFNLLNFLAEADDIPALWTGISSKAEYAKKLWDRFSQRKKRTKRAYQRVWGDAIQRIPDLALEWNLGYAPSFGDAQALYENMDAPLLREIDEIRGLTSELVESLEKQKRKIARAEANINEGIGVSDVIWTNGENRYLGPWGDPPFTLFVSTQVLVRAFARFKGESFGHSSWMSRVLDGLGIYPDLSTLWNALPFTFLIDYVLPVGDIVERKWGSWSWAEVFNGDSKAVEISDACISVKTTQYFQYRLDANTSLGINPNDPGNWGYWYLNRGDSAGYRKMFTREVINTAELDGLDLDHEVLSTPVQRLNAAVLGTSNIRKAVSNRRTFTKWIR